jgi:uncharacterized protein
MKKEKRIKVVFDTNIWISFILSGKRSLIHDLILDKRLDIYASEELAEELFDTLKSQKFKDIIDNLLIASLKTLFYESVIFVVPKRNIKICRDPKDDFLLALAIEAKSDYLINSDHDLLELDKYAGIKIMKPVDFKKILVKQDNEK